MSKTKLILITTLAAMVSYTNAGDLAPGKWEVKQTVEGEQLPPGMDKGKTSHRCITAKEAESIEQTMRQASQRNSCDNPITNRNGNTLSWTMQCNSSGRTVKSNGTMTVHNKKHYTSNITTLSDGHTLTVKADAIWTGLCEDQP